MLSDKMNWDEIERNVQIKGQYNQEITVYVHGNTYKNDFRSNRR